MSSIGGLSTAATQLASSVAGTLKAPGQADRAQEAAASRQTAQQVESLNSRAHGDEVDIQSQSQVADRDADGREAWEYRGGRSQQGQQPPTPPPKPVEEDPDAPGHILNLDV